MKNYYYYFSTRSPYRKRHFITTRDGLEEKKASLKGRFLALSFKQTLRKNPKKLSPLLSLNSPTLSLSTLHFSSGPQFSLSLQLFFYFIFNSTSTPSYPLKLLIIFVFQGYSFSPFKNSFIYGRSHEHASRLC